MRYRRCITCKKVKACKGFLDGPYVSCKKCVYAAREAKRAKFDRVDYVLRLKVRSGMHRYGFVKVRGDIEKILGYTMQELKAHIEAQFRPGMSWDGYLASAIHIDHIVPLVAFKNREDRAEAFAEAWSLRNLQPLWAKENYGKAGRIR